MSNDTVNKVKHLEYDKNEWYYEQSDDRKCRFLLGKNGKNPLICFGVNPSTASPNDLDPTMKNVEKIAKKRGYDGYIMLNLYPMRSTDPKGMDRMMDENAVVYNLEVIKSILKNERMIYGLLGGL